tara:strand:- start:44 stop:817 length:774 start_codon:yes stop_codon:yes gene_type:complete
MKKNFKLKKEFIIVGDVGNTDVKICILKSNHQIKKKIIFNNNMIDKKYLEKKLKIISNYKGKVKKILFSSVVPKTYKIIKIFFEEKLSIKCNELKSIKLEKLLKIKVNRKQIGSDRIANAIAVCKKNKNFIVIDFGTATTLDVITHNIYLGGVIAPGVKLSLETLISKATLIPVVNLSKIKKVIGNNTKSAVKSGFYWGYSGLIESLIKLIIKQTRKSFDIILTGGLAHLYKDTLNKKVKIDKDLTIKGLTKILKLF